MLSAGIVMGIMIIPYVSSLSEDAMRAVPNVLREASYAMGATKLQTAWKVVLPAAISGIAAAFVLGISRAIGETMVVAIAAGQQPNLTLDPTEPAATITAYIVQVALGDLPHGSIGYQSIFAAGLTLLLMTLCLQRGRARPAHALSGRPTDGDASRPRRCAAAPDHRHGGGDAGQRRPAQALGPGVRRPWASPPPWWACS